MLNPHICIFCATRVFSQHLGEH